MSAQDDWPTAPDGSEYNGQDLLHLMHDGRSPFAERWDAGLLIREIEDHLAAQVVDIPAISKGSNNYVIARLARGDVNMPGYDGFTIDQQVPEVEFEAAVYELLQSEPAIRASRLLYHRVPVERPPPHLEKPVDIVGRRLLVFERADGDMLAWRTPTPKQKAHVLAQSATIRAALFNFTPPLEFAAKWFLARLFDQKPESLPVPVAPTRHFCIELFVSKIHATIKSVGDMIGWEDDHQVVGPVAAAAKQSLLRLIPHIMPPETTKKPTIYRLVLDHGDFGIHNMSITADDYRVTSVFDWETECIVPAILSDPSMAVVVDLVTDEAAAPSVIRVPTDTTSNEHVKYMAWATQYIDILYEKAPEYQSTIKAGRDARHLWFALRDWRGDDPEGYFGTLGTWAERRLGELTVNSEE
ncbi:hypothetical protein EV356DRAFT_523083 [Viridothelium virens]|uniref:Uncharacterized protein n=1 Tax=Viridothelium virens TaxID=1048519 RepID=A0A6A6HCI5_VIRVR|nr:hypothetical protein EV356DRAFT_523083 [Viridothelium virens]